MVSFDGRKDDGEVGRAPERLVLIGNVVLEEGPKQARLESDVAEVVEVVEDRHWRGREDEQGFRKGFKAYSF